MFLRRWHGQPWAVLGVVMVGTFMALLDLTIVNIAIPSILDDLHASLDQVLWVLNAYSLVYAVLLITSARLGDIFGHRRVFSTGVLIFTAGSLASGLAQTPIQLIIARAAQGLGAAVMTPQGLPLITALIPVEKRGGAFAGFGILAGLAVLAGPTLGGAIVSHWGWRWIFDVNIPIGLVTAAAALAVIPDIREGRRHRLDIPGVVLVTAGLLGVVFGLIEGQRYAWGVVVGFVTIPMIIIAGVLALGLFVVTQAMAQVGEPLINFAVFRDRNFTIMCGVLGAMGFAILGLYLPLTIYYQSVLGLSAIDAGLTIAVQPVAMMAVSGVAASLANRYGKYLLIPGLLMFAAGSGYIDAMVHADAGRWSFLPGLVLSGLGMGLIWTPVYALATRDLTTRLAGVASGILNTIQELGTVLASAAVGALLQNRLAIFLHDQAVAASNQLPRAFRSPFVAGFSHAGSSGLEVGAGQTGGSVTLPPGVASTPAQQIQAVGHSVFAQAYSDAMRPTLLLPITVIVMAAACCLAVRARSTAGKDVEQPVAAAMA